MINDTEKQLTIGRAPMERVRKLLKDYCYALYLGAFGAYLFGFVGLFLFGAWGLWNDRKVVHKRIDMGKQSVKENLFDNTSLRKKNRYSYSCLYSFRYIIWVVVVIVLTLIVAPIIDGGFHSKEIETSIKNHAISPERYNGSLDIFASVTSIPDFVVKISYIIPFTDKYITHMQQKGLDRFIPYDATVISILWILCALRSPKLFQYFNKYELSFERLNSKIKSTLKFVLIMVFIFTFYAVFIGVESMFQMSLETLMGINMILVPLTWVLFCILISIYKIVPMKLKN